MPTCLPNTAQRHTSPSCRGHPSPAPTWKSSCTVAHWNLRRSASYTVMSILGPAKGVGLARVGRGRGGGGGALRGGESASGASQGCLLGLHPRGNVAGGRAAADGTCRCLRSCTNRHRGHRRAHRRRRRPRGSSPTPAPWHSAPPPAPAPPRSTPGGRGRRGGEGAGPGSGSGGRQEEQAQWQGAARCGMQHGAGAGSGAAQRGRRRDRPQPAGHGAAGAGSPHRAPELAASLCCCATLCALCHAALRRPHPPPARPGNPRAA